MKGFLTSEGALIVEALLAVGLLRWWAGFEITVLATLAITVAHVFKLSYAKGSDSA